MLKEPSEQLHAIIRGRVQGVAFRHTTKTHAKLLGIVGTVRNLSDGSVEIYAQGPRSQLDLLLDKLTGPEGPGKVESVDKNYRAPSTHFHAFEILFD